MASGNKEDASEHAREELLRTLDREHAQLEAVLRQMPAGVIIAEAPSGKLILGNAEADKIWRAPFAASANVGEYEACRGFHPDGRPYRPEEWPLARSILQGEEVNAEEIRILRGDESEAIIEVSSTPVKNSHGEIVAGVVTFRDITQRKAMEARLREHEADLERKVTSRTAEVRELAGHLERVREEEKRALARDLHDDLGSTLTALAIHFAILERRLPADPVLAEQAAKIKSLLGSVTQSTRRIQSDLRPVALDALGLAAAIENQVQEFGARTHIECQATVPEISVDIDPAHEIALFRMLQESLANISKHAQATKVDVRLEQQGGAMVLMVRDNGRGIAEDRLHNLSTHGLRGMRERAVYLGGSVTIGGDERGGTCIVARLPIKAKAVSAGHADPASAPLS